MQHGSYQWLIVENGDQLVSPPAVGCRTEVWSAPYCGENPYHEYPLDDLFAGEAEVRLLDPRSIEFVEAIGCTLQGGSAREQQCY